ncbi:unnamed protein product, partial [Discosporangium mesarthrocarpum]
QTTEKVAALGFPVVHLASLNDINAGSMQGLTHEEVAKNFPEIYSARARNKLRYRYPNGESYEDVFRRVEPVILEMMGETSPVIIISHLPVLRILYGYLTDTPPEECPSIEIPLNCIIMLSPMGY